MSKKRYEWVFENGENEIIDNLAGRYITISSPELLNEKDEKISDLEEKLAEYKQHTKIALEDFNEIQNENDKLAHQLAEKDKAIEKLKSENHTLISDNAYQEADMFEFNSRIEQLQKQLAEKEKENEVMAKTLKMTKFVEKEVNQDKISFAVEQLEKVKEFAEKEIKECNHLLEEETEDDYYTQSVSARQSMCYDFRREINNQINQLKEG